MTKPLKGLPARTLSNGTNEEFISSRHIAGIVQPVAIMQPDSIVQELSAFESRGAFGMIVGKAGTVQVQEGDMLILPCCLSCGSKDVSAHEHAFAQTFSTRDNGLTVPPTIMDEGTVNVAVGGSVSGVIDFTGDTDLITVNLVAGQTYLISLVGTGANGVNDTFLTLNGPGSVFINEDDDGGNGLYSLITVTAAVTGTYEIVAASFNNPGDPGTGDYTVTVQQQGPDEAPTVPPGAPTYTLGATTYGFLNPAGDGDIYQVTLTAGTVYSFSVAAGADYNSDWQALPAGEVDTIIEIFDANGVLVASGDDISFPDDISSSAGFLAEESGTYFVRVRGYPGQTGGYTLDSEATQLTDLDPLDAIDWASADNVDFVDVLGVPTAYVYFALAGESFGELNDAGNGPRESFGWNATEIAAVMLALEEYEHILGVNYEITTDVNQATFRLITTTSTQFGAYFYPQDPAFGTQQGIGAFNVDSGAWSAPGQPGLVQGGYDFSVILHEFGHAHGLAHPHDNGGGSDVLLGVTASTGSYGIYNLNQGVYTVMSYNDAWDFHPDGGTPFTLAHADSGWSGTLSAFDIAVLQQRYGVHAYNGTDTVYALSDDDNTAYYATIWDSGGTDAITYGGAGDATIDLTAATLDYSPTGGGVLSFVNAAGPGIFGGYTIANGVVIENATSGSGDDLLIGNSANNVLTGNDGDDIMIGREGDDTLDGGTGSDTVIFGGNFADYTITDIGGGSYTVEDNNAADGDDGFDTVIGADFIQFNDAVVTIDPDPNVNVAPTLSGLVQDLTFGENLVNVTPQLIDGDVVFQDEDGNFDGGLLAVSGLLAEDRVAVRNEGVGAGQIGVSGNEITYSGIVIGTFTGGVGNTFTVTLNASANAPSIDALIENLTYANVSQDPTANRTLTINITDDEGVSLVIVPTSTVAYTELTGANDPLANPPLPTFAANPNPGFIDVDSDGDLDMIMGSQTGTFRYFQKSGATYTEIVGAANPFNGVDVGTYSNPDAIDLDGDGDMDMVSGSFAGTMVAFRNNGAGSWTQLVGAGINPFNGIDVGAAADVAAVDVNGDGRMDLVVGSQAGAINTFIHNADHTFTQQVGAANPFNGVNVGTYSSPAGADVDGDGDMDVVFGNNTGTLRTFLNSGGVFTEAVGAANPFNGIDVGSFSNTSFADLDGDGDADLIVGDFSGGDTRVFRNDTVISNSPNIDITVLAQNDAPSGTDNAITIVEDDSYTFSTADFGYSDVDGDAFSAVVINTLPTQGVLTLNGVPVTAGQAISVADIGNGLLAYTPDSNESGPNYASFTFSVRDDGGTANGGANTDTTPNTFAIEVLPENSPPRLTDVVDEVTYDENVVNVTPQILDFDVTFTDPDDNFDGGSVTVTGLLAEDVVSVNNEGVGPGQIGLSGSNVTYGGVVIGTVAGGVGGTLTITLNAAATSVAVEALIENLTYANTTDQPTATRTLTLNVTDADGADLAYQSSFEFTGVGVDNPFDGLSNGGSYSTPTFLDVDSDGDLDLLSGGNTGAIFYYRNDGGTYAEVPGSQNPFNGIDIGAFSVTAATNIDADGDLDLVIGDSTGVLATFRNNGNGTFTQLVGAANPFNGIDVGTFSNPTGGDIDGDGDMDLVVANGAGTVTTLSNNGNGTFTNLIGAANPFNGVDAGSYATISLFDIDGDGDLDALMGNSAGSILAYNNGGVFTPADPEQNPFEGLTFGYGAVFGFADLDGDGDLDAVGGSNYGDFLTFENTSPSDTSIIVNVTAQVDIVELYDENDVLVETYSTIQLAIDNALDGYSIVAPAGTYNEDLTIDVDVTISGANAGTSGTGVRGAETVINGSVLVTANGATVDGVTITGDALDAGFHAGVNVQGDDFSLVNSVLSGRDGDFIDDTVAVFAGNVTGLDIGDNLITGYLRGVYLYGGTTEGAVHDNLFQGAGSANWFEGMGNGVNSETSLVIISGNTFDGIWAGVLNVSPFGPGATVDLNTYIFDNVFTGNNGDRPIQVYPTPVTTDIIGTDENEAFNGDIAGLASGTSVSFDGMGGDDHIYGWDAGDELSGGSGSDRIFAQQGDDLLNGGAGNDLLDGDAGIDTASFVADNLVYTDTVLGWLVQSSEGNDFLQEVEIVLDGDGDRSLLVGSTGFATIQAAFDEAQTGDTVRLAAGNYTGTHDYDVGGLVVIAQPDAVQNVTYTTSSGLGIIVYGANAADSITTDEGDDYLIGGGGNDTLAGGAGNDTYYVDGGDLVLEADGEGNDRIATLVSYALAAGSSVELLEAQDLTGTDAINLTGNELANTIVGNGGANILIGGAGNDVLIAASGDDFLVGGEGDDVMEGGFGNDTYYSDGLDTISEDVGGGTDRVAALDSVTLTAGAEIELLEAITLSDTTALELVGNEFANTIIANNGDNLLDGKDGNDVLQGLGGADTFAFTTALGANNVDLIKDFDGDDGIDLAAAVFSGIGPGPLSASAFTTGGTATTADHRIVYNEATGELYYDADGNGVGAQVLFATLEGSPILVASDFSVI